MIPISIVFKQGNYDDREIITDVLGHNDVRDRMSALSLGKDVLTLGKWVQERLRVCDVTLTSVLIKAECLALRAKLSADLPLDPEHTGKMTDQELVGAVHKTFDAVSRNFRPSCGKLEADEDEGTKLDLELYGAAFQQKCYCGRMHRLPAEGIVTIMSSSHEPLLTEEQARERAKRRAAEVKTVVVDKDNVDALIEESLKAKKGEGHHEK